MFFRFLRIALGWSLCCAAVAQQTPAPSRKAFLILNGDYQKLARVSSAHPDAAVLREALTKAGFSVTVFENCTTRALARAVTEEFATKIGPGDDLLVFFAGYAVQSGEARNFLLPVDFDPQSKADLEGRALKLTRIQQEMEDGKARLKIIVVAATPNEMLPGLSNPDLSESSETAVLFASAPAPAAGSPGFVAAAFARAIQQPGSALMQTLSAVQKEVLEKTGNRPSVTNNLTGESLTHPFYFVEPPPPPPPPPVKETVREVAPPPAIDLMTKAAQVNRVDRKEYAFIPKGTFQMGCVPSEAKKDQCEENEKPRHEVRITHDLWMGATEVTIDAYNKFVEDNRGRKKPQAPFWKPPADHPVVDVNWDAAAAFCRWVGGRLPSEAEWEYAARGGTDGEVYPFNSENSRDKANFDGTQGNDHYKYTAPVKSFDHNGFGLYDMAGNVWEWTGDWFGRTYYAESPPRDDPKGPASGTERVVRGGSFYSDPAKHLRISFREKYPPQKGQDRVGFRCVLEDGAETRKRLGGQ